MRERNNACVCKYLNTPALVLSAECVIDGKRISESNNNTDSKTHTHTHTMHAHKQTIHKQNYTGAHSLTYSYINYRKIETYTSNSSVLLHLIFAGVTCRGVSWKKSHMAPK